MNADSESNRPRRRFRVTPRAVPVLFFLAAIAAGSVVLKMPWSTGSEGVSWIDSIFTAVSATCVTGLTVVDTGTAFTTSGQAAILLLIQIGGLGIMTFTSLALVMAGHRLSWGERAAVSGPLLRDSKGSLQRFLRRVVGYTLTIEAIGAAALWLAAPRELGGFQAVFHAISAFCNAGFSLRTQNLMGVGNHVAVAVIVMLLIILGGLGFVVLLEGGALFKRLLRDRRLGEISDHFRVVIKTSAALIVVGAALLFLAESLHPHAGLPRGSLVLSSFFQSVTARTAGFNTVNIGSLTNASLLVLIMLMFVGGAPGSCAGGVKVTTLRVLASFVTARMRGRPQVVIGKRFAVDRGTVSRALTLVVFSMLLIGLSVLVLDFTEGGSVPHPQARGQFLEVFFEAVSAFGTVGLSTGLTPSLSIAGKIIVMILMFVGRLGPLVLMSVLHDLHKEVRFSLPEEDLTVG